LPSCRRNRRSPTSASARWTRPRWDGWLAETARDFGIRFLSIVGRPVSSAGYPLALSRAIRLAAEHRSRFTVGAVVIAERHTQQRSESARMLAKGLQGCGYFISQTVYRPHATERLLRDYLRDCRGAGVEPRRVILTFSPVGREKTLTFLQWLGVQVPEETARTIFGAANPLAQSIEICRANLRRILERGYNAAIPIGVNVESVSINRDEIDASIDLAHALGRFWTSTSGAEWGSGARRSSPGAFDFVPGASYKANG
jgi:hypothetical protein